MNTSTQRTNALSVGVLLVSADRQIQFADSCARTLLGHGAEGERRWAQVSAQLTQQPAQHGQFEVDMQANGAGRGLRFSFCRVEGDGYVALVRDHAHLAGLDTDLRLATQLRGLAKLFPGIAHDLRGPLNAMVINLELLKEIASSAGDARQGRFVAAVRDSLTRLNKSLDHLFDEIGNGSPQESGSRFDLRDLVAELQMLLNTTARLQRVHLSIDVGAQSVPLNGDRGALRQALVNVALNALDAMPDVGQLQVRVHTDAAMAGIEIEDSGPGIVPELLPCVGRLHYSTKPNGTGAGLYVARSVAESFGGSLEIESAVEQGTRVRIRLPLS